MPSRRAGQQKRGRQHAPSVTEQYKKTRPDDVVSFSVVARPRPGVTITEVRDRLTLETWSDYRAPKPVLDRIAQRLRSLGFEVFDLPSPVVSARGRVSHFLSVFGGDLVRRIRTVRAGPSKTTVTSIVLRPDSTRPSLEPVEDALLIAVVSRPLFATPRVPPATKQFNLRVPGDVAQLTLSSVVHRQKLPAGLQATGAGIGVAVLDTGFARHPYYDDHGYQIKKLAAPDTANPDVDDESHGTALLATLLACAPDVDAYGIKLGENAALGFDLALTLPSVKVLSVSWVYDLAGEKVLPLDLVPLRIVILNAVTAGVAVVTAGGNGQISFPAMMPEVIAIGGVAVDPHDRLSAWSGASSFVSTIFNGRAVPDVCAVASEMTLPAPGGVPDWHSAPGTSYATPQVSGIVALLLQKNQKLTPDQVLTALKKGATDVKSGKTAMGDRAVKGDDLATGAGLVNAREAWQHV
jgi:serine protease AprX